LGYKTGYTCTWVLNLGYMYLGYETGFTCTWVMKLGLHVLEL
jgi:hypothetical protein